ncbi:MAG: fibronectin type III domain-containing protein, partial [Thermoplasmatales archaeon]|nr:fibronectin type III domain-containing protein [Thermoplasmatales archaeon]
EWYSYKDGYLGEGFQILKNLSNGQHNITVQIYVNNVIIASRCVGVLVEETISLSAIQTLSIAYTGNNIYTLSWTAVCEADSMFAEYRIYVSDSELSIGTLIENITDINQTTYQLGLEPGSSYWISVIWTDTTGSESNPYRLKVDISKSSSDMIPGLSRVNEQMGLIIMLAGAGALVIVLFASRRRNRTTVLTETHNEPAQEQQDQDSDDTKQINEKVKGVSK